MLKLTLEMTFPGQDACFCAKTQSGGGSKHGNHFRIVSEGHGSVGLAKKIETG